MSEYKYLDIIPQPLRDSIIHNRCLPIVGSGFSKNADIPKGQRMCDWGELGRSFAEEMPTYEYSSTIDAVSAYEHAFSRPIMVEKMKSILLSGIVKPGTTHEAFCQLQFDIVCTTNFDHLLEEGYQKIARPCCSIISESQLSITPRKDELTLLKFHGDIDHPDKMVVTEEDYDKFLEGNPMMATYLSNLLITRTPLFIGYSLDDDDFRQIWQIVKNRLGNMIRQAYVIKVNCSETERMRYERRGVKVVNIEGDVKDYPSILKDLFIEMKTYWDANVKTIGNSTSMSELALPKGSQTRLCFFSAPNIKMAFYKDVFFPIALKHGFTPITADSVISPGENWMAKVSSLISKIDYFVVDIGSQNTLYEFIQITRKKTKDNILVIKRTDYPIPNEKSYKVIVLKDNSSDYVDSYLSIVESWFKRMAEKVNKSDLIEPRRLLEKEEYNAAVISAVVHLEVLLRKRIETVTKENVYTKGLYELMNIALKLRIIKYEYIDVIRNWINLRNKLVHTDLVLDRQQAVEAVNGLIEMGKIIG